MRFEGSLKSWNDERGFGFIEPDQGGDEIFVHIKAIANLNGRPALAQRLSFEVELGPQGKKRAKNVLPIRQATAIRGRANSAAQWGTTTLFAIPGFLVLYAIVAFVWRPSGYVALVYLVMTALTFAAYAADKSAALNGTQRIPESNLHGLALLCGWPGALVAQQVLRHKSTKTEFRSMFRVTVMLNVSGFVAFCSPLARSLLPRVG